jgi:hypothetical protein
VLQLLLLLLLALLLLLLLGLLLALLLGQWRLRGSKADF